MQRYSYANIFLERIFSQQDLITETVAYLHEVQPYSSAIRTGIREGGEGNEKRCF